MAVKLTSEETATQVQRVNDLLGNIKGEFESLIKLARKLGYEEAKEEAETDKINYAIEIIVDMLDRCEKPAVILSELRAMLTESPF